MRCALTFTGFVWTCFTVYVQAGPTLPSNNALIDWTPCGGNELIECGFFDVPLDYADPSVGNATLAVSRYKSTNTPRLGTLFTNPGGPGESGSALIQSSIAELIRTLTNAQYDIVGWDPRGVNLSTPTISCGFNSLEELESSYNSTVFTVGVEAHGNFTDQGDIDNFYNQLNQTDADLLALGQKCNDSDGAFLKYMGTAAVVRDMVSLSDYLEGPGQKIQYWGFSYGTVIGNYFVNMFPDRVGRVILDGVVDTNVYSTEPSLKMWSSSLGSVEDTFAGFVDTCAQAGPQGCAIAQSDSTGASIAQWVRDLIDVAYSLGKEGVTGVSSTAIRGEIFSAGDPGLYKPTTWVDLASLLAENFAQLSNITQASGLSRRQRLRLRADDSTFSNDTNPVNGAMSFIAITCVDSIDQDDVTTKDVFDELLRVTHEESPTFGELMPHDAGFFCHRFPARAVERFVGPFNNTPAYPIVVIGNQADPITPFANARAVAFQYGDNSRLIEQDDFGHASVAERSDCTHAVVSDYFLTGALPTEGKVCGTNQVLFPGPGITKSTLDSSSTNPSDSDAAASVATNNGAYVPTNDASNVEAALGGNSGSSSEGSDSTDSEINKLTKERDILAGVAGAFVLASLIMAGALIFTCLRRRNTRYASPMAASALVTRHDFHGRQSLDSGEHQPYSDPWEGRKTEY